jgi:hypothetical protein
MRHLSSPITAHHALVLHVGCRRRYAEERRNSLGGASLLKIERLLAWGARKHTYTGCTKLQESRDDDDDGVKILTWCDAAARNYERDVTAGIE